MVEDHHYCRGLDTQTVAVHTTDGNGAGVFFVLKRKKKEREKKSLIKSRYFSPLRRSIGGAVPPSRLRLRV